MQPSIRTAFLLAALLLASCSPEAVEPPHAGGGAQVDVETLYSEAKYAEVVGLLERKRATGPLTAEETMRLAQSQLALGEIPKAVLAARNGMAEHPEHHRLALLLAEVYVELNQYSKAVETLRTARANGCPDSETTLLLGVCLGRLVDLEGARAEFERARAAGVAESEVDYNLAVLLFEQGEDAECERLLRHVRETAPAHPFAERELARVLIKGATAVDPRVEEAETLLNANLDRDMEDWRTYELLGDVSMLREDFEAAVAYYEEALRYGTNPVHVEGKYRVAKRAQNAWLVEQGIITEKQQDLPGKGLPVQVIDSLEHLRLKPEQGGGELRDGGR
jgi:Flp pilus assembly protein TadD